MRTIEAEEAKSPPGYGKPPWVFKGSALYQLHLVKADTARAFIPQEFKLVEAFGYTLGGFFLAKYDDSPAGSFDELVVIAGIVWNPPTSCAWAARVLVNSDEACIHGRKEVGLPSQVARFSKTITAIPRERKSYGKRFLNLVGIGTQVGDQKNCLGIQVKELEGTSETDICSISTVQELKSNKFIGPVIKMSLPSFSGNTEHKPQLLKYSCQLECRVRVVEPAKVSSPCLAQKGDTKQFSEPKNPTPEDDKEESRRNMSISVMLSKPIFALEFNCLKMQVEAPVTVSTSS